MTDDFPDDPHDFPQWRKGRQIDRLALAQYFADQLEAQQISVFALAQQMDCEHSLIQQYLNVLHGAEEVKAAYQHTAILWTHARDICQTSVGDHDVQRRTLQMIVAARAAKRKLTTPLIRAFAHGVAAGRDPKR